MNFFTLNQVSITFHNRLSQDLSHAVLYENEESFQELMKYGFKISRKGSDMVLYVNSETELYKVRQITQIPLFIKF